MAKTLVIQPVTRIEGHAKVTIQLNDAGNVDSARVNVIELRGFEKFCMRCWASRCGTASNRSATR